ncbi:MAG: hypothetical protein ACREA9_07570 [Pyrinomonadaceae bacterium]
MIEASVMHLVYFLSAEPDSLIVAGEPRTHYTESREMLSRDVSHLRIEEPKLNDVQALG